jgi:hypothetical protein
MGSIHKEFGMYQKERERQLQRIQSLKDSQADLHDVRKQVAWN